jgi:hypothetical protein
MQRLLAPFRFGWNALRGHWLRPWRSPYLRWRIETYSGIPAGTINAPQLLEVFLRRKGQSAPFPVVDGEAGILQK